MLLDSCFSFRCEKVLMDSVFEKNTVESNQALEQLQLAS